MSKRPRGTGSVFQLKGRSTWWIKYYRNGVAVRESAHTDNVKKAEKLLQKRIGEVATGTFLGPRLEKVRMSELAEDLIRDYRINGLKSIDDVKSRWDLHLKPFFGLLRAVEVSSQLVAKYVDERQQGKAGNATINRELAALKRMFNLARESTPPKVASVPYIPMLKESNIRTGFLETAQHDALAAECAKAGLWLRAMFEVGYALGWRHSEVLGLRVRQVDMLSNTIRLEVGTTKNGKGRQAVMTQGLRELMTQCMIGKKCDDALFTRSNKKPVRDFRTSWDNACKNAAVPGLLFHDLRRTAVRNMVRAGIPERVAMQISGHKTRAIFDRYDIVSERDLKEAAYKLENVREPQFGHHSGIIQGQAADSRIAIPVPAGRA